MSREDDQRFRNLIGHGMYMTDKERDSTSYPKSIRIIIVIVTLMIVGFLLSVN